MSTASVIDTAAIGQGDQSSPVLKATDGRAAVSRPSVAAAVSTAETTTGAEAGVQGACLPQEPSVDGRRHFETEALIHLAGLAGEWRCRKGSAPGWVRQRSRLERNSYHEAAHGLAAHLLGRFVWHLSIIPDETIRMQKTLHVAGYAWSGRTPEPPVERPHPTRLETDLHSAAHACHLLALVEPAPFNWKTALHVARRLRAEVRSMVDQNWYLLVGLAEQLLNRRELSQVQISRLLKDETRGSWWRRQ